MNRSRQFLKTSAVYFVGNVLTKLISFLLLPLYTAVLSQAEFGYSDTVTAVLTITASLVAVEIWSAVLRYALDYAPDELSQKWQVINNGFQVIWLGALFYTAGFAAAAWLLKFPHAGWIYALGLAMVFQNMFCGVARSLGRNTLFMLSGVAGTGLTLVLNYLLLRFAGLGLRALFISAVIGFSVQCLILMLGIDFFRRVSLRERDRRLIGDLFQFAWPLCINAVSFWLLSGYSKVGIAAVLGFSAAGVFAAASRFASMVSLVTSIFNLSWQELAFSSGKDAKRAALYSRGFDLYFKLLGLGILILIPLTRLIFGFMVRGSEDYGPALSILPVYFLATLLSALTAFLGSIFGAEKKTRFIFITTLTGSAVNVGLLHLLMPWLGVMAAVVAMAAGFGLIVAVRLFWLRKHRLIRVDARFAGLFAAVFALVYGMSIWSPPWLLALLSALLAALSVRMFAPLLSGLLKRGKADA